MKLKEIANVIRGITFSKKDQLSSSANDTIKVVTTKAAQEFGIVDDAVYHIPKHKVKDKTKLLRNGDILISTANSLNLLGRTTFVDKIKDNISFGAFMSLIRANKEKILPLFLFHVLRSEPVRNFFYANAKTTTNISNLSFLILNSTQIPLPPLSVQEEIVAEIEGYQKIIDGAKMVVENYKPKIDIDPDWEMVELGEIADITSSKRIYKDEYVSSGIPFYRTKEIVELSKGIQPSLELFISEERYEKIKNKYEIPKLGDILISAVGTLGVSWVVNNPNPFYFKDGNLVWFKDFKNVDSEYLKLILDVFVPQQIHILSAGAAYKALTIVKLKKLQIPLPEIEVQKQIVAKIEKEQELVNANKELIKIFEQKIKDRIAKVWGE